MLPAPRQRRVTHAAAVAVLVPGMLVAGCSGTADTPSAAATSPTVVSPSGPASAGGSAAPSAMPAVEPTVPEPPEPPARARGPEGQKAFARYVMAAWSWSLRSNDASPLLDASPSRKRACDGCRALADELALRAKQGWYVDFPGLEVTRIRLRDQGSRVLAAADVVVPESRTYFDDGTYRSTNPAHRGAVFSVLMERGRGGYRLLSFSLTG